MKRGKSLYIVSFRVGGTATLLDGVRGVVIQAFFRGKDGYGERHYITQVFKSSFTHRSFPPPENLLYRSFFRLRKSYFIVVFPIERFFLAVFLNMET